MRSDRIRFARSLLAQDDLGLAATYLATVVLLMQRPRACR
jgi:hypothetical protein